MGDVTESPVWAEICHTCADSTTLRIHIHGVPIEHTCTGEAHYTVAQNSMDNLNARFDKAWAGVKETSVIIMERFSESLRRVGVAEALLEKAIEDMIKNVEK